MKKVRLAAALIPVQVGGLVPRASGDSSDGCDDVMPGSDRDDHSCYNSSNHSVEWTPWKQKNNGGTLS
ncbi:MAG: hypothetical protein IK080_04550 [Clostridia bacterium]|nr:hypothetical protein [Clostridia bacterium]